MNIDEEDGREVNSGISLLLSAVYIIVALAFFAYYCTKIGEIHSVERHIESFNLTNYHNLSYKYSNIVNPFPDIWKVNHTQNICFVAKWKQYTGPGNFCENVKTKIEATTEP